MTRGPNDPFAERLKRIEEQRGQKFSTQQSAQQGFQTPRHSELFAPEPPKRKKSMLPWIGLGAGMFMLGTVGFNFLAMAGLSDAMSGVTSALGSLNQPISLTSNAPSEDEEKIGPRSTGRMGYAFGPEHVATASGQALPITAIMDGFQPTGPNSPFGNIATFDANEECVLTRPTADQKLVNVNISNSLNASPVQVIDREILLDRLTKSFKEALEDGEVPEAFPTYSGKMRMIDVIVTDTSAPLYLALQTMGGNVIWNVHAAPDVKIEHVSLVAYGASGVTGNIGNASIEAVRARDFGEHEEAYYMSDDPTSYDCMARPFREPNETWSAWEGSKDGNMLDGNLLYGQVKGYDAYAHWFNGATGFLPSHNSVSAFTAGQVLVGPAPETPIPAPDLTASTWHVLDHDLILSGTDDERVAETNEIYMSYAGPAANGDPFAIMPAPAILTSAAAPEAVIDGKEPSLMGVVIWPSGVKEKVSTTEISYGRRVTFDITVSAEELLGQAMPEEEDLRNIYGLMRAPRYMMPYCEDTLGAIATTCAIEKLTARWTRDGNYDIRATFGYIHNYELGTFKMDTDNGFITAFLPDPDLTRTYQTAEERQEFLKKLRAVCDVLREEYGNCIVGTAGFYLDDPASFSSSGTRANAAGWVEVYAIDNPFEERNFNTRALKIFESL